MAVIRDLTDFDQAIIETAAKSVRSRANRPLFLKYIEDVLRPIPAPETGDVQLAITAARRRYGR